MNTSAQPKSHTQRVVVVEDDPVNLETMHDLLCLWGYRVESYHDPIEALQTLLLCPEEVPDLIVSDLRFECGMGGFELIDSLRAIHPGQHIPAVMVTGDLDPRHKRKARDNLITIIYKPMRPAALQSSLAQLCPALKACA
jgi:two-component system, sensor histidine kinase